MFYLRKGTLAVIFLIFGFSAFAQHTVKDSLNIWRTKSRACARFADSVRIIASGEDGDHVVLEERLHAVGDSLNRLTGWDFAKNIHNDPLVDSLSKKLANLSMVGMFLTERFEYHLVQIDSCLGAKQDLEIKIYEEEHKKTKSK
jgi:hypothetical protein